MEEDIEYLKRHIKAIGKTRSTEAIENLINKYKEQEKHIEALNSVVVEHIEKSKEQQKIIELMAEKLAIYKFEEIICMETECEHVELQNEGKCIGDKECILEYFKKKARISNDKLR